jgi:hypothetical protein
MHSPNSGSGRFWEGSINMCKKLFALAAVFMLIVWAAAAHATTVIACDVPANITGNQNWTGSLGMDFDVNRPIAVTAMGVYESGGSIINGGTLDVEIFNATTQLPVTSTLTSFTGTQGTPIGGSRFLNLPTPVTLPVGEYTIVAWGYGAYGNDDPNGNLGIAGITPSTLNTGGGAISFVGLSLYSAQGTGGIYPNIPDTGPDNRYYAGTFEFVNAAPVPLPPTLLLLGSGLMGLGLLRFRRKI